MKGFLIAGTASGVGKTTVMLAVMAAMRRRGLVVQPFKGGPDFLDTGHHTRLAGRVARNLDTWMLSFAANKDVFREAARDADVAVVEGMMGLFDGTSGDSEAGSSAEIAKLLKLPVVLVLDAGTSARSIAAVVLGFEQFDPELALAGVILNRCAGESHFHMLQTAIQLRCRTPILGWLPCEPEIAIPERHLGLQTAEEASGNAEELLASLAEEHLDIDQIIAIECGLDFKLAARAQPSTASRPVRIGVARDRAFSFYYADNFDLLQQQDAVLVPFSPLDDATLPEDLDALYLGGGYPELYAEQLSSNTTMLASIRQFALAHRPIYAECGGLLYLSSHLTTLDGRMHMMAGVLPFAMEMTNRLVQFGYVTVELTDDCLLGKRGTTIRGHSFHHARRTDASPIDTSYRVQYSLSGLQEQEGYSIGNVLASYIHLHFCAEPSVARHFVERARAVQAMRMVSA